MGPNARTVPADKRVSIVPRAHMDYAFLQAEIVEEEDEFQADSAARVSLTILVMFETLCDSVWAYTVAAKGVASDPWLPGVDSRKRFLALGGGEMVFNGEGEGERVKAYFLSFFFF